MFLFQCSTTTGNVLKKKTGRGWWWLERGSHEEVNVTNRESIKRHLKTPRTGGVTVTQVWLKGSGCQVVRREA